MKYNTKKTISYYWKVIINYKFAFLFLLVSIITASILDSIIPIYLKNFFNVLANNGQKELITKVLLSIITTVIILKLLRWIIFRSFDFMMNFFESKVLTDLYNFCFVHIHKHSFAYFSNTFTGSIVKKVKGFSGAFENLFDQLFYDILPAVVNVVIIISVLASINLFLGLGMLVAIIVFVLINFIFVKYKMKFDMARTEAETAASSLLADTVTNNTNIKLFNGYKIENKNFFARTEHLRKTKKKTWDIHVVFITVQSFLLIILEVGMYLLAINLWTKNMINVGDFVLIQSYIIMVLGIVWNFGRVLRRIYESLSDAEEMTVILQTPYDIVDVKRPTKLKVKNGEISFENVCFAYENNSNVVDNFSLDIKPKETVALVGSSGAGKTTLVKLILRMFDIQKGKILIDGQDIAKVSQESLRQNVSLVPQDPILFHRSLMENIRYGKPTATNKEVFIASKLAHCDEFISKLEKGYDTFVGERGIKLSGGERQRVAIARAILRNAPILIMDEATSSLDSESEKFIQDSLDKLMKEKTVIIVAHRLSTIKKVDRIVVIDKKKIVEDGTHNSLIQLKNGIYKKLWDIQVGGFIK